jgi:cytochrome bd-type quinol oxidase subunit 2
VTAAEVAGFVALLALFYPQIVPPSVTLHSAAASRETIDFLVIVRSASAGPTRTGSATKTSSPP